MNFMHSLLRSPEACGLNRLSSRANLFPFPDFESAKAFKKTASPYVIDLNGTWKFRYLTDPENLTEQDFQPAAPLDGFEDTEVPDCWVMRGHGVPHYTNVVMPFPELPPEIPAENPAGIYRRTLEIPETWDDRRKILHFDGADSCFFAWLNGKFIGMSKDSRGSTEFDVTEIAKPGKNDLAVLVTKWCDATYLEDQDQWYLPGLSRSVYIYSTDKHFIADVFARSTLNTDNTTGRLKVEMFAGLSPSGPATLPDFNGYVLPPDEGWTCQVRLFDPNGKAVWDEPKSAPLLRKWHPEQCTERGIIATVNPFRIFTEIDVEIPDVRPWSAETPELYTVTVELVSADGKVSEATGFRVGFRRYEIRNREFLVNGKKVLIFGVNRHEHHETKGKAVPYETAKLDVELLKRFNFNAVRTSHYPSAPEFYDLCDEYGLYVIDETNLETHAYYDDLTNDPRWATGYVDRAVRNFERDKNHACIYAWSLGNESGVGPNHAAMAGYIRFRDPSRLVQYQGATSPAFRFKGTELNLFISDFQCPMYITPERLIEYLETHPDDQRPIIMCEFSHAMGNSNGSLKDYFHVFRNYHGLQGGYIWEWLDHGIKQTSADGKEYWAYGGDFGDVPHDSNFVCDGLVWPDRTPHPAMYECKYLAQPAEFTWRDAAAGRIRVLNRQYFRDLAEDFKVLWKLEIDGVSAASGECDLPSIAPQTAGEIAVDYTVPPMFATSRAVLKLDLVYKHDMRFTQTGEIAGWEALDVPVDTVIPAPPAIQNEVKTAFRSDLAVFSSGSSEAEVTSSGLMNLRFNGQELLEQGPRVEIWRAPLDNDGIKMWRNSPNRVLGKWLAKGYHRVRRRTDQFGAAGEVATLHQMLESPELEQNMEFQQVFRMLPDGKLEITNTFMVPESWEDMPRLGLTLELPAEFRNITYWGNGPFENYIDRDAAAKFGCYTTTPEEMYTPYIMPQSSGNRTGVVKAELHNDKTGLRITAPCGMEFGATPYAEFDLYDAMHTFELKDSGKIYVRLDLRQRGVGTASCGPDTREDYKIKPGRRNFTIYLEGFEVK